jgi:quercetin dioxygenase-like cupin family protein
MRITRNAIGTVAGPSKLFTGAVYIDAVATPSGPSRLSASSVHFTPGARTAWYTHPNGQTICVTEGVGLCQRRSGPVGVIRPGDRASCEPGAEHWHGAAPNCFMAHLAMQQVDEEGNAATWGEHVTDEEYGAALRRSMTASSPQTSDQRYEVTPLELFFDLVFVFAVSQLSHHLLEHVSWRGAAETLVMLLAVFAVWYYTTWAATMIPAHRSRTLWMVLAVMLLGLFMNASVSGAFATSGWAFVVSFLLAQLGRTYWTIANAPNAVFRDHFFRTLLWLIATSPFWIVGAAVGPEARLPWWAAAGGST